MLGFALGMNPAVHLSTNSRHTPAGWWGLCRRLRRLVALLAEVFWRLLIMFLKAFWVVAHMYTRTYMQQFVFAPFGFGFFFFFSSWGPFNNIIISYPLGCTCTCWPGCPRIQEKQIRTRETTNIPTSLSKITVGKLFVKSWPTSS